MNCPKCATPVQNSLRNCPACETDVGFPNVRAAQKSKNIDALQERVKEAEVVARARKCDSILNDFGNAVSLSKAVFCRNLSCLLRVINSDSELINTYYKQVRSKQRQPENNDWDASRGAVDSKLFPNYHDEIHCAYLTVDNDILESYGDYGFILKESAIAERATVFEENAIVFCEKHGVTVGRKPIPDGYRAVWDDRKRLAIAKLHSKFDLTTKKEDFPKILFDKTEENGSADFIEVHIYGTLHRKSFECILGKSPKKKAEKVMFKSLQEKLKKEGIPLEAIK